MFEAIGNIGSFIGGVGVALSVVYLAVQIRISSQTAKASAAQIVMQSMSEYFRSVSENAQLAKVITIAYKNIDSLEEYEITQFFFWSLSYWRLVELAHHHYLLGNIPDSFWKGQVTHLSGLVSVPALARFWTLRKSIFSAEFQKFIDGLDPKDAAPTGEELLTAFKNAVDA